MQSYIYDICQKEKVDYYLVVGTILHESSCDPNLKISSSASGYMQLMDSTWHSYTDPSYIPPWSNNNEGSAAAVKRHNELYKYVQENYNANIYKKNDPYMNIAVGIASYSDLINSYPDMSDVVQHYGEGSLVKFECMVSSSSEILYYRDILANQANQPTWYIDKYYTIEGQSLITNYDPVTKTYISSTR